MKKTYVIILLFFSFFISNAQASSPIKILLVPGHDNIVWGAQYGNMKEATMTLALATKIYNILKQDPRFEVHITRDSRGYIKEFTDYFSQEKDFILAFEQGAKKTLQERISGGNFVPKIATPHIKVKGDIALRLYGFNKWANENNIDAVVHVHFNDYPRSKKWTIGEYHGFTIYMPDQQFPNYNDSANLAKSIFTQLNSKYSTSTYKPEEGGLVPDQKLIALGSNGTLNASVRSVLIEYSYIYEKKFRTKNTREQTYIDMANLTANGIQNYFFPTPSAPPPY